MGYIIKMPKLGFEMERGHLLSWEIDEGEAVAEGNVIAEIESEKNVAEVESREAGILRRTYLDEGQSVPPGTPIGIVAPADEEIDGLEAEVDDESDGISDGETTTDRKAQSASGDGGDVTNDQAATGGDVRASPRARTRAEELGVDLTAVDGTGYQGAITEADVEEATATTDDGRTRQETRTLDGMRRTIASRLGESYREAVHVTVHRKADAEALFDTVSAATDALGTEISVQDVLLLAVSATLKEHPEFNATFEDDEHVLWTERNIGLAVDVEHGLITPVLPAVGEKPLETIATERRDLVQSALDGEYTMDDLRGGTFTITNLGPLGVEAFDPIINPPQIAILGVDAIDEAPVRGTNGELEWRRQLPLDLTFDHRIVDGADAARFLETLVEHIEDPWPLLPDEVDRVGDNPAGAETEMPDRTVTAQNSNGMAGTIRAGSFEWRYDEPEAVGGTETGPTPVDVFLGALASCLSLSIRFQANKRDTPVDSIEVTADAEPSKGAVEHLEATVRLETDADDEAIGRLVDIGERGCHVSQLVGDNVPLNISWERV